MAKKDLRSYFSHDADARNDEKIIRLRMRHGAAGYGVFFMILERLRGETDYTSVKDYNMIAFDLRVDAALIKSVVEDFGLFAFTEDGKCFYSESFLRRMELKDNVSRRRREAVAKRWGRGAEPDQPSVPVDSSSQLATSDPQRIQTYTPTDTIVSKTDYNKSKVKKSKENNKKISPDGDTKKDLGLTASVVADVGVLETDFPSGLSPNIADILRRFLLMASKLATDNGLDPDAIRSTAIRIAGEWNLTGEYSRKDPVTHLRNVVLKILRKHSEASAVPRSPYSASDTYAADREAERREREETYSRDSAAELAAYLRSRGLSPGDSVLPLINQIPSTQ